MPQSFVLGLEFGVIGNDVTDVLESTDIDMHVRALSLLTSLPPALPIFVPDRLPQRARRRTVKIGCQLLKHLMTAMHERNGTLPSESEVWFGYLCKQVYPLLFHQPTVKQRENAVDAEPKQWKILRRR